MDKESFSRRFLGPVALVFVVMALSWSIYMLSPRIPSYRLYQIVAIVSGIFLFLSLGFGALYVYYVAYVRGAGSAERIIAAFVSPFAWMTKEVIVVGSIYSVGEALYYYLNPVHFLLIGGVVAEMGVAEMLVRRGLKKTGAAARVFTPGAVTAVVLAVAWIVVMFAWDFGVHHFYIFQEGFKALFGYGSGV